MKRLINLCELLYNEEMTREEISTTYDFDPRQTNYYADAGRYLGIIDKKKRRWRYNIFFLTSEGREIFKLDLRERQLKFIELILKHNAFNRTLREYFKIGQIPSRDSIVEIMKESNLYRIDSENTFKRRAGTISSWVNWILDLVD